MSAVVDLEVLKSWYAEQGVAQVSDRLIEEIFIRIVYRREPKHVRIVRVRRSERLLALPASSEV